MSTKIKDVTVIDPQSPWNGKKVDILLENGLVSAINPKEWPENIEHTIEGNLLYVSPSWTDLRVFSGEPGEEYREDWDSLTKCLQYGGFGRALLMPNTNPVIQTRADIKSIIAHNKNNIAELLPASAVTTHCDSENLNEMMDAHHSGAVAFTDGEVPIWNSDILLKSLQYLQVFDGLLINYPEDQKLALFGQMNEGIVSTGLGLKGIPHLAEELIIKRDIDLLKYAGGKIHFSGLSSAKSVELIKEAKSHGLAVTADVAIRNLIYTDEALKTFDTNFKLKPVLRSETDRKALIKGVNEGVIDAVVSNHQPFDEDHKNIEFDLANFGAISLQIIFPLYDTYLKNDISLEVFIKAISTNPNRLLGLKQSTIAQNQKVDFTVFSTDSPFTFNASTNRSLSKNCPEVGNHFQASPVALLRGQEVFHITA